MSAIFLRFKLFDITSDDISQLNDIDLRELVGRLCEAELASRNISTVAVTWGGNQTAADGGLDVRIAIPSDMPIDGFIPRHSTGFQVKKPDMPRGAILKEMRPNNVLRPVIHELTGQSGAYIIVSSTGSTADSALSHRRNAMRTALHAEPDTEQLHTDFYDRTRIATWVRNHPGLIAWVKERVGRALLGWQPYGSWCGRVEGVDAEYLLDDRLRLHLGGRNDDPAQSIANAIDELRDGLNTPGKIVRLVGLSGVGKTRLVQALFDARVGKRPLAPSLAVYTNLSDHPDPQPTGLASDLIANRRRAILIVDNCPPDLHHRLSLLCNGSDSTVSVLTVEYDVRGDQPERTQVVTLDTSSPELIEQLIQRRFPHLSQVDGRTIAVTSGGNARIAIALAETVEHSGTIAGLSNDELFQRLFRQGHAQSDTLFLSAQACSLVYSFQGETLVGNEAELPRLGSLVGQSGAEIFRHVGELDRRNLVQRRGHWRAVLPHAIANRLAARALEDTPYDVINQVLVASGSERLAQSFSRRLSFLHDHPRAVAIVDSWLAPGGLLGDLTALNAAQKSMFENIAPVLPEAALYALERTNTSSSDLAIMVLGQHLPLLRSLAYDQALFERSAHLLIQVNLESKDKDTIKNASDIFASLFTIYLSGTHATIEQRLGLIESLLRSGTIKKQTLGFAALSSVLKTMHFSSGYNFDFGARSRDYGYQPRTIIDLTRWYATALTLIERLAFNEGVLRSDLRDLLARNFRGLWSSAHMHEGLERLSRRFVADGFWLDGWSSCRQTIKYDLSKLEPTSAFLLSALEADMRPSNLSERVRAIALSDQSSGLDFDDIDDDANLIEKHERLDAMAQELGGAVATDDLVFAELLPDMLRRGVRSWSFGCGLAEASPDLRTTWAKLLNGLYLVTPDTLDTQVLRGFLAKASEQDGAIVQDFLNTVFDQPALVVFLPLLQTAVGLDELGAERLMRALHAQLIPIWMYRSLAHGRSMDQLAGGPFKKLILLISEQTDGFDVALEILYMRLFSEISSGQEHAPEILDAAHELLKRVVFRKSNEHRDHHLAKIVKASLISADTAPIAAEVASRLQKSVATYETSAFENNGVLLSLMQLQPIAVLSALFSGNEADQRASIRVFDHLDKHQKSPMDMVPCDVLIAWCEEERCHRYILVAEIITFASRSEGESHQAWSDQAIALLSHAPDPQSLLSVFIERFWPTSWSGSRATLAEANARLLDNLGSQLSHLQPFVTKSKVKILQEIANERARETKRDSTQDERFE